MQSYSPGNYPTFGPESQIRRFEHSIEFHAATEYAGRMADSNPYRSPLAYRPPGVVRCSPRISLAIGLLIDAAGALLGVIWLSNLPLLRVFLPFAAAHAVAGALITFRAGKSGQSLSSSDHFFLRYGAVLMAVATAAVRSLF